MCAKTKNVQNQKCAKPKMCKTKNVGITKTKNVGITKTKKNATHKIKFNQLQTYRI